MSVAFYSYAFARSLALQPSFMPHNIVREDTRQTFYIPTIVSESFQYAVPFLSAALTLGGGLLLFVASQLLSRFVLDPIGDLRRCIGEVAYAIMLHRNVLTNIRDLIPEQIVVAESEIRRVAARLGAFDRCIPWHETFAAWEIIPCRRQLAEAVSELIGLSNTNGRTPEDSVRSRIDIVHRLLRIRDVPTTTNDAPPK